MRKSGRQDEDPQPGGREIEEPLDEKLPLLGVGRLEVEQGQAVELGDRGPGQLRVEQVDGDGHHDPLGLAVLDRALERIQARPGNDEDDLVHGVPVEDPGDVLERADDLQPADPVDAAAGLVVDGPEDLEAPLRMLVDLPDELDGPLARPDDQQTPRVEALAADVVRAHEDGRLLEPDEEEAQAHEEEEEEPAHEGQLEEEDERPEQQERHDRGLDDGPEDLEIGARPHGLIHAVGVERQAPVGDGEGEGQPELQERDERGTRGDHCRR